MPRGERRPVSSKYKPPKWCGFPKEKPRSLWLEIMKDRKRVGKYSLLDKPCHIVGRDARCELVLKHLSLSRQHAAFIHHSGENVGIFIVDLGSTHGTFVQGKRLDSNKPERLVPGCNIRFGASTRRFYLRTKHSRGMESKAGPNTLPNRLTLDPSLKKRDTVKTSSTDATQESAKIRTVTESATNDRTNSGKLTEDTGGNASNESEAANEQVDSTEDEDESSALSEDAIKLRRRMALLKQKAAQKALMNRKRLPKTIVSLSSGKKSRLLERLESRRRERAEKNSEGTLDESVE